MVTTNGTDTGSLPSTVCPPRSITVTGTGTSTVFAVVDWNGASFANTAAAWAGCAAFFRPTANVTVGGATNPGPGAGASGTGTGGDDCFGSSFSLEYMAIVRTAAHTSSRRFASSNGLLSCSAGTGAAVGATPAGCAAKAAMGGVNVVCAGGTAGGAAPSTVGIPENADTPGTVDNLLPLDCLGGDARPADGGAGTAGG